jgi:nicotinate-nucleotide pyrophosphorylase (carboxylating)
MTQKHRFARGPFLVLSDNAMPSAEALLQSAIERNVRDALAEDVGDGDMTAALIPEQTVASATIVTRQPMRLAGVPWVDEVYRRLDARVAIEWLYEDGDAVTAGSTIARLHGPARALLTGERTALNFLQLLSGTATATAACVAAAAGTRARILDTRKTLPGLRVAQKYAVRCGGGTNHRLGLFDGILIKENHIETSGGIGNAVAAARRRLAGEPVEVEVETLVQLREALRARADRLLLDNFSLVALREAVDINRKEGHPPAELEASGGVTIDDISKVAATGVDYISVGSLTKHVSAVDLSMRIMPGTR